jgi:YD repeat-containing protein
LEVPIMRTTCSLVLAAWFLAGTAPGDELTSLQGGPEAAKKLFDLPEASEEEYAQVEGTWELAQDTDEANQTRRVKTHQDGKTTVTAYDAEGNIVGQHNSQYKLKKSGLARVFVFFKIVPAMGPSKGREFPGPFYYAYNVHNNKFIEVYGVLKGDDRTPRMLYWNRVKK